jgi:hypothetical protein
MRPCHCLYCGILTGHGSGNPTVCGRCVWSGERDERREVEAGVSSGRPWMRPLSFWTGFFGMTPMPDAEAAVAQAKWDAEQERIKQFNAAHSGQHGTPEPPARPVESTKPPKIVAA